jgi:RimJ/RimL family protein N-acetyltransferase
MTGALDTARLRLERWDEPHTALLVRLSAIPEVMEHIASGEVWAPDKAEQVARDKREHWVRHGFGWRAAIDRSTGEAVGFVALNFAGEGTVGLAADEYEIGWWLAPEAWGRGLAREGAVAVRDDAFQTVGASSVVARVRRENHRSIAVAESIGLTFDFETAEAGGGRPLDVYRLTAADWKRSTQ